MGDDPEKEVGLPVARSWTLGHLLVEGWRADAAAWCADFVPLSRHPAVSSLQLEQC